MDSLVGDWYTVRTYRTAYAAIITPVVEHESIEILSSDVSGSQIAVNPPASRRPPGRPCKTGFYQGEGEYQVYLTFFNNLIEIKLKPCNPLNADERSKETNNVW